MKSLLYQSKMYTLNGEIMYNIIILNGEIMYNIYTLNEVILYNICNK